MDIKKIFRKNRLDKRSLLDLVSDRNFVQFDLDIIVSPDISNIMTQIEDLLEIKKHKVVYPEKWKDDKPTTCIDPVTKKGYRHTIRFEYLALSKSKVKIMKRILEYYNRYVDSSYGVQSVFSFHPEGTTELFKPPKEKSNSTSKDSASKQEN